MAERDVDRAEHRVAALGPAEVVVAHRDPDQPAAPGGPAAFAISRRPHMASGPRGPVSNPSSRLRTGPETGAASRWTPPSSAHTANPRAASAVSVPGEARHPGGVNDAVSSPARSMTQRAAARRSVASWAGSAENSARRIRCCGPSGRRLWS